MLPATLLVFVLSAGHGRLVFGLRGGGLILGLLLLLAGLFLRVSAKFVLEALLMTERASRSGPYLAAISRSFCSCAPCL